MGDYTMEEVFKQLENLNPAVPKPCDECPWRRDSARGYLGPLSTEEWLTKAHSDAPIECHKTVPNGGTMEWSEVKQCKGAAIFRANVCKIPIFEKVAKAESDTETIFANDQEFSDHHKEFNEKYLRRGE